MMVNRESRVLQYKSKKIFSWHKVYLTFYLGMIVPSLSCFSLCGFAQQVNVNNTPQVNPGLTTPTPIEQLQEDPEKKEYKAPFKRPPEKIKLDVPQPDVSVSGSGQVMVKEIQVVGYTLIEKSKIDTLAAPFSGKTVNLEKLGELVSQINQLYYDQGFLTTQTYIPPQDISTGVIKIEVVEGRIGKLKLLGSRNYREWVIQQHIDQQAGDRFNIRTLEDSLNLMNQQQDYRAKATLSPGEKTGETDIVLEIAEPPKIQISPTFDNQGRPFIGTYRWGVDFLNRSVFGLGDRFNLRWIGSVGNQLAIGSYFVPVGKKGDQIGGTFSFSRVQVDLNLPQQPDIEGEAYNYGLIWSHPFDKRRVFTGDVGLNVRRVNSYIDALKTNQDDIHTLQTGLTFNKPDKYGRTIVRAQTTVGAGIFGGNRQFWKAQAMATRILKLPKQNLLIIRGHSQLTPDALPAAEQFQAGGAFSVRGYTEGLLVGDRGYNLGVEHRFPVPGLSKISETISNRVQGATFFDVGQTWLDTSNANFIGGISNSNRRTLLVGAGVGVRAQLSRFLQGFVDFGFGLADRGNVEPLAQPDFRVHFGIRSNLINEEYQVWNQNQAQNSATNAAINSAIQQSRQ